MCRKYNRKRKYNLSYKGGKTRFRKETEKQIGKVLIIGTVAMYAICGLYQVSKPKPIIIQGSPEPFEFQKAPPIEEKVDFKPLATKIEPPEIKEKAELNDNYTAPAGIQEVKKHIVDVCKTRGLKSDFYLRLANCESGFKADSVNYNAPRINPVGTFQFTRETWRDGCRWRGLDWTLEKRKDHKKSLDMAIWFIEVRGEIGRWECWTKNLM